MVRLWTIEIVAESFHILPTVAAEALDDDAEGLILSSLNLLTYARAKSDFDRDGDKAEERWEDPSLIREAADNAFDIAKTIKARRDRSKGRPGA